MRIWALSGLIVLAYPALAAPPSGEAIYARRCAVCHEQVNDRIPSRQTLQQLPAQQIVRALNFGAMMSVGYNLTIEERSAVAKYLGTDVPDTPPPASAFCSNRTVTVDDKTKFAWNGWSLSGDNTRFVPADVAKLTVDQVKNLKLKWAFGFGGDVTAFAPPAIFGNQMFLGSASGAVQALDARTGCIQWIYNATGPVRSAIRVARQGSGHVLLFGDQIGWYYAVAAETGKELWKKKLEPSDDASRLTGSAIVNGDIVYVPISSWDESRNGNQDYICCTARGGLFALRIRDGSVVWKSYMVDEAKETGKTESGKPKFGPSGVSIWSAPTLDLKRRLIYVTTGDNFSLPGTVTSDALVALDLATGKILWSKQVTENDVFPSERGSPDFDFGSSPMLVKDPVTGRELVVAGQKSGLVYAFDPDKKGEIVWQVRVGKGGSSGGVQWGTASDGRYVYAATSDKASVRGTGPNGEAIRTFDKTKGGGLTALKIGDGSKAWFAAPDPCTTDGCSPAQSEALTVIPGVVFSGSYDGHIRAYSTEDGKVVWDFNTLPNFQTVNGVKAHGGALDGAGPVIVNGLVLVNSGYPRFGGLPGNVLLAFTPDGK